MSDTTGLYDLYKKMHETGLYPKSFSDFEKEYSDSAGMDELYSDLISRKNSKGQGVLSLSKDQFRNKYYPHLKKNDISESPAEENQEVGGIPASESPIPEVDLGINNLSGLSPDPPKPDQPPVYNDETELGSPIVDKSTSDIFDLPPLTEKDVLAMQSAPASWTLGKDEMQTIEKQGILPKGVNEEGFVQLKQQMVQEGKRKYDAAQVDYAKQYRPIIDEAKSSLDSIRQSYVDQYEKSIDESISNSNPLIASFSIQKSGEEFERNVKALKKTQKFLDEMDSRLKAAEGKGGVKNALAFKGKYLEDIVSLGWSKVADQFDIKMIADKYSKGKQLSRDEEMALAVYAIKSQMDQQVDTPISYDIASGIVDMIPFMAQFAFTGGTATIIEQGASKAMNVGAQQTLKNLAKKGAAYVMGKGATVPTYAMFSERIIQGQTRPVWIEDTENENKIVTGDKQETLFESTLKAYGTVLSEVATEGIFSKVGGVSDNIVKKVMNISGWSSLPEEFTEEMINAGLSGVIEGQPMEEVYSMKNVITTFGICAVTSGAFQAGEVLAGNKGYKNSNTAKMNEAAFDIDSKTKKNIDDAINSYADIDDLTTKLEPVYDKGIKDDKWDKKQLNTVNEYILTRVAEKERDETISKTEEKKVNEPKPIKKTEEKPVAKAEPEQEKKIEPEAKTKVKTRDVNLTPGEETTKAYKKTLGIAKDSFTSTIQEKGKDVGKIIVEKSDNAFQVKWVEVDGDQQRRGIAAETYNKLNKQAEAEKSVLKSDRSDKMIDSKPLWESLVKKRKAVKLSDGTYVMKNKYSDKYINKAEKEYEGIQTRNKHNRLIDLTREINEIPLGYKKQRGAVMKTINRLSLELGYSISSGEKGRLNILSKGKPISKISVRVSQEDIEKHPVLDDYADKDFTSFVEKITSDISNFYGISNLGLSKAAKVQGIEDIKNKKKTVAANSLLDVLHGSYKSGEIEYYDKDSRSSYRVPIEKLFAAEETEISPEEEDWSNKTEDIYSEEVINVFSQDNPSEEDLNKIKTKYFSGFPWTEEEFESTRKLIYDEKANSAREEAGATEVEEDGGESESGAEVSPEGGIRDELEKEIDDLKKDLSTAKQKRENKIAEFNSRKGFFGDTKKEKEGKTLFEAPSDLSQENLKRFLEPEDNAIKRLSDQIEKLESTKEAKIKEASGQTKIKDDGKIRKSKAKKVGDAEVRDSGEQGSEDADLREEEGEGSGEVGELSFAKQKKGKKTKKGGIKKAEPIKQEKKTSDKKSERWIDEDKMTNEGLKGIEAPELIEMIYKLTGKFPSVTKLKGALGKFYYSPKAFGIKLSRKLFEKDGLDYLAKVIAHEFGHMINYLPGKFMDSGNILGRIMNVRAYFEHTATEKPGGKNNLTDEDRDRIRRDAKVELEKEYEAGVVEIIEEILHEEPIFEESTLTVDDIMAIWNSNTAREANPDLYNYIAKLSAMQKKNIIKQALRGLIDSDIVKKFSKGKQVGTKITKEIIKKIRYPDPVTKESIHKKYLELLNEEINKRKLFENEVIREELKRLTLWWNPFNPKDDKKYTQYRFSGVELYAEALSVLFNNPQALAERAPYFNRAFMNYFGEKPSIKEVYDEIQDLLTKPRGELLQNRLDRMISGFKKADAKRKAIFERKVKKLPFRDQLSSQYVAKSAPLVRRVKAREDVSRYPDKGNAFKNVVAKLMSKEELSKQLDKAQFLRNLIEKMKFVDSEIAVFTNDIINQVVGVLDEAGIGFDDFRAVLQLERTLLGKKDIARPLAFLEKASNELLSHIDSKYNKEQGLAMKKAVKTFHDLVYDVFDAAHKAGIFSDQQFKVVEENRDNYVTTGVVEYIDKNYVSPRMMSMTGTVKESEDFITTVLKVASVIKATTRQNAITQVIKDLKEVDPDNISDSKRIGKNFENPVEKKERIEYWEDGKWVGKDVDPYIAEIFRPDNAANDVAIKAVHLFNKAFKPLVTTYKLGWAYFSNIFRDTPRTMLDLFTILNSTEGVKDIESWKVPISYGIRSAKKFKEAWRFVKNNEMTPIIREMMKEGVISKGFFGSYDTYKDQPIETVLKQYGLIAKEKSRKEQLKEKNILLRGMINVLDFHLLLASTIEVLPKIVAYDILKKNLKNSSSAAFYTRNYMGTPNYKEGGTSTKVTNELFVFSNVIVQSLRADSEIALDPRTRGAYWIGSTVAVITPAVLVTLAATGLLGDDLEEFYAQIPEYDKTNYICIPIGRTDAGKVKYLRFPLPELSRLLYAITYKSMTSTIKSEGIKKPEQLLAVGTGLMPSPSPILEILSGTGKLIAGKNIVDSFTDRNVFSDKEMAAGGKYKAKKYLQWLTTKMGGEFIVKMFDYDPAKNTTTEYVMKLAPIFSRAVKVSDYQDVEFIEEVGEGVRKEKAVESLENDKIINKAVIRSLKEGYTYADDKNKMLRSLKEDMFGTTNLTKEQSYKFAPIQKIYKARFLKGVNSPFSVYTEQIIYSKTNDEKVKKLEAYAKHYGHDKAIELIKYLYDNEAISENVKIAAKKQIKGL